MPLHDHWFEAAPEFLSSSMSAPIDGDAKVGPWEGVQAAQRITTLWLARGAISEELAISSSPLDDQLSGGSPVPSA
jgi:hypothetical protein